MAHFYGTVQGGRGVGSRLGHKTTGLRTIARGWNGSVEVRLFVKKDEDWATVRLGGKTLYDGPLNKYRDPRGVPIPLGGDDVLK